MGVKQFLSKVLPVMGRPVDLRQYSECGILPSDPNATIPLQPLPDDEDDESENQPTTHDPDTTAPATTDPQITTKITRAINDNTTLINSTTIRRRPLRIAIDISAFIFKATQGFGRQLGDERHLTNWGRAKLHFGGTAKPVEPQTDEAQILQYVQSCTKSVLDKLDKLLHLSLAAMEESNQPSLLVVFDGQTPPIKAEETFKRSKKRRQAIEERDQEVDITGDEGALERRLKAFQRAGAGEHYGSVVTAVMTALREKNIPFLVAPYEADGQLAYLSKKQYIDLVITEDSDLIAYGASPILYKCSDQMTQSGVPSGILVRRSDLAANTDGKVDLTDFSDAMLAVLFVCLGSDYCPSLRGIGIITACDIVRPAFFPDKRSTKDKRSPLEYVLDKLLETTKDNSMTSEDKDAFCRKFVRAVLMFRHPVVYDPVLRKCVEVGDPETCPEPELTAYEPYRALCKDSTERVKVTGPLVEPVLATYIAEGWISPRTRRPRYGMNELPPYVRDYLNAMAVFIIGHSQTSQSNVNVEAKDGDAQMQDAMTTREDRAKPKDGEDNEAEVETKSESAKKRPRSALADDSSDDGVAVAEVDETDDEDSASHLHTQAF